MRLILLFWLLLLSPPTRHSVLIPAMHYDYAGARDNKGVAWQDNNRPFLANRLGVQYWYNASSHRYVANGRSLPMIRPHNADDVIATLGVDYDGYLLILNEPEQAGQDNITPRQAVSFVNEVHRQLPYASLVGPNITPDGFEWLAKYLEIGRPFDVLGIHIYQDSPCSLSACIDALCDTMMPCRVWVTEVGSTDPAQFSEYLSELESDSRVERIFVYTAINGCCDKQFDLIVDGEVTKIGRIWQGR